MIFRFCSFRRDQTERRPQKPRSRKNLGFPWLFLAFAGAAHAKPLIPRCLRKPSKAKVLRPRPWLFLAFLGFPWLSGRWLSSRVSGARRAGRINRRATIAQDYVAIMFHPRGRVARLSATFWRARRGPLTLRFAMTLTGMPRPAMTAEERRILRAMTPAQKLAAMERLYWTARSLKAAWLRSQHPDWSEAEIQQKVREIFRNART